jgi:hypothetical protein
MLRNILLFCCCPEPVLSRSFPNKNCHLRKIAETSELHADQFYVLPFMLRNILLFLILNPLMVCFQQNMVPYGYNGIWVISDDHAFRFKQGMTTGITPTVRERSSPLRYTAYLTKKFRVNSPLQGRNYLQNPALCVNFKQPVI